jgi:hypothetical protein
MLPLRRLLAQLSEYVGLQYSKFISAWRKDRRDVSLVLDFPRYTDVSTKLPPGYWAPCHPQTLRRFKASIACPKGHQISLLNHSISEHGAVTPSVICLTPGCTFHEFIRLEDWDFGSV